MLKNIYSTDKSFAGITIVFGGDFQQTLPVIVKGTQEDIILATLQCSTLWNEVEIIHLYQNMWVVENANYQEFSQWLLNIGHGQATHTHDTPISITVPQYIYCSSKIELIASVYGSMTNDYQIPPPHYFKERAILAVQNKDIQTLNSTIFTHLPGAE